HTILPWLRRFESAFQRDLISDDDRYFVEFDVRGLMRGDAASRSAYYRAMWDIGALSTNDILELENRNPVDGGDERYRPLNMGTLGAPPSVDDVLAQQQEGSGIDGQAVEGGVAAAEGEPAPVVEEVVVEDATPQVAEVSLNGALIIGLIAIVQAISDGLVTREGAAAMIAASFPSIPPAQIDAILAGVVERQPAPAAVAQPQQVPVVEDAPARSLGERAEPGTVAEGDFVSWGSSGGRARGRIDHVMDYGRLDVPGTDFAIDATEDDPAALVTVYEEVSGGWRATDTQVGHKVSTLTKIDALPEPPPAEEPRAKPRRRKRG
ncbi:MAG: phage portal protein, partial [Proteobacteria bacterium]|nr:phage portal protein [Pseudomonadota bacterium]